jgi:adenine-specific DNA-methyltransferase
MSDKMKFETPDLTAENVAKIAQLFPGLVSEGNKVNFDLLRTMLGDQVFKDEVYEFTWVGKRDAIAEAGRPIRKTLRPVVEDETTPTGKDSTAKPYCSSGSRNWDTTENLYIEGDNLEVLKLLQESYLGKVKMIYIDPPYNTGNDFIYKDDFAQSRQEYDEESGVYDEAGNRLFRNTESNGRFHSDWCSMMYPRLVLARNLLRDDGVIFISIDDNEIANLMKICDEIYGENNFVSDIIIRSNPRGSQEPFGISREHEYVLCYAKSSKGLSSIVGEERADNDDEFDFIMANGSKARLLGLRKRGGDWKRTDRPNMFYPLYVNTKNNRVSVEKTDEYDFEVLPLRPDGEESRWTWGIETAKERVDELYGKEILRSGKRTFDIYRIDPLQYEDGLIKREKVKSIWLDKELNYQHARQYFKDLFGNSEIFDFPKPPEMIIKQLKSINPDNDIILDFFSGSATTAHAIMQLNAEDGSKRKFIMVQLPEVCANDSEAAKAGYKNICEIGKERIRRAGNKIKAEAGLNGQDLDIGFRVLKVDDSNMNDVYFAPADYSQDMLRQMEDNIKSDRTDLDLLFGCLLDWGLPLSMPHTHEKIDGFTVHTYNNGDLIACFDEHVSEKAIREIAARKPLRAVFRDSSFTSSPEKINVFEIFKLHAANTTVKVL